MYIWSRKAFLRYLVSFIKPKLKIFSLILAFSLVLGSFFVPDTTKASFFSDLFNNDASASINITKENIETNSQNIGLLEAKVSSITVLEDKKDKNSKDKKTLAINKDANIISENNALVAYTGLRGVSNGTDGETFSDVSVYVVRKGDSIAQIATMFDVSADTIRWSNDIKSGQKINEGDILFISPVSGVIHTVKKGDTLKSIAKFYKVNVSSITSFNDLDEDQKLEVGDDLIVPDGEISNSTTKTPPKTNSKNQDYDKKYAGKDIGGYFTNPAPQYVKRTQVIHGNNSTDLAGPIGTPIVAAADGVVLLARNEGWNGAYGKMIVVKHPNGTDTLYAHLSKVVTWTGATVSRGEIIGYMGSTGRSTGSHLHFEVHGARNFTLDLPKFR